MPGSPVIIRSRVDENQIWHGTMGAVDEQNSSNSNSSNSYMYGSGSGDDSTSSSSYPFYVTLDSSDGLMLGQHVYIEMDEGQEEQKTGIWLGEHYIVDADTENPYVWAADSRGRLEKRPVILGQYDENLSEYEIVDGLTEDDSIAFPSDSLTEGMTAKDVSEMTSDDVDWGLDMESSDAAEYTEGDNMEALDGSDYEDISDGYIDEGMDEAIDSSMDEETIDDNYVEDDMEDYSEDDSEDFSDDTIDEPGQYGSNDTEAAG